MISINASEAQPKLYDLIEETGLSHKPLIIAGDKSNAVLISEDDWESVQETLYLLSIPNMRESIREGLSTYIEECAKDCRHLFLLKIIDKTVPSKFEQKSEDISIKDIHNSLKGISDINDLINFGKRVFPESEQYLFELVAEAMEDFDPEEEGDEISVESLKGMLLFLYSLKRFKEPEISISETGVFYVDWEEEVNDSLTVRFKDDFLLEYSLFQPSVHTDKWNIRNGKMHVSDFKDDLLKLGIKLHTEI